MNKKNPWILTFSDLITLLITFFTLIISMSSMNNKVLKESFRFFSGGPGIMDYGDKNNSSIIEIIKKEYGETIKKKEIEAIMSLINRYSLSPKGAVRLYKLKEILRYYEFKFRIVNNRDLNIYLNSTQFFYPVSIEINDNGKKFLNNFIKLLYNYNDTIILNMYTSKFPVETENIKNNIDFSIKRLSNLVDFLLKKNININKVYIMGWGDVKNPEIPIKGENILKISLKNYL